MPELIFGFDRDVARWVAERIPEAGPDSFQDDPAIGIAVDGRLIAGVVFSEYKPQFRTIELSIAADSPMWARRDIIAGFLAYPFIQLDCFKVWTAIPLDNEPALKANFHAGFKREAVLAHQFGRKRHCVVSRMLQPDYRRLYGDHNG